MCVTFKKRVLLLYGTQQGQSKAIAEEIGQQAEHHGFIAEIFSLKEMEKFNLKTEGDPVVIVISTTGTGDPPDPALPFVKKIQDKDLPEDFLAHLKFAILALGDSEYTYFCNGGKIVDRRLQELGAKHFYETGYADDCIGLELVVDPWIEGLWTALNKEFILRDKNKEMNKHRNCKNNVEQNTPEVANISLQIQAFDLGSSSENSQFENAHSESKLIYEPSLVHSASSLSQSSLNVPSLPPSYLDAILLETTGQDVSHSLLYPEEKVFSVSVTQAKMLTLPGAVKTTLNLELDISDTTLELNPGDSFSIICPNTSEDVKDLLDILDLSDKKHCKVCLRIKSGTTKKGASIPRYIPEGFSLECIFSWCLEIRAVLKRAMIRSLVEHTKDPAEKRRLQELCSKQGSSDYNHFIRDNSISILDLLKAFPSCKPPLSILIEHLPKLQARPYSASSSPLYYPGKVCIVFNVIEFPACPGRPLPRKGVCTGWLAKLVNQMNSAAFKRNEFKPKISIFARSSSSFKLPTDTSLPVVMVGPGTGIAPFIGFLQHREKLREQNKEKKFGEIWLFFGCRSYEKDYLFREELRCFIESGSLTCLKVCFSRDPPHNAEELSPKYVHDYLRLCSRDVARILIKENGNIFVCGDAKNMAKDVNDALTDILSGELNVDKLEAMKTLAALRDRKQYLQDVWS
ncbi:hypothetical protein GDO86_011426 [Hymenochirus boettgeri]|uniref:Methionine synthase reductase n=1 Tax=Hymenochirus boettgeri TaxID=247094 RepID=A0A8T2JGK8_9PIPI|nr:hypothetical protein GDO86_011426 [Hymenochirus boettgeri]